MTPLEIGIMIHYYAMGDDYREGDFSARAVAEAMLRFLETSMLKEIGGARAFYAITPKGRAYVEHLCSVPLPVVKYVIEYPEGGK